MKTLVWILASSVLLAPVAARGDTVAEMIGAIVAEHRSGSAPIAPGRTQGIGGDAKITAITPDGVQILVSKLQSGQRWAVGLLIEEPFSVSGNVVAPESSTTMWCEAKDAIGEGIDGTLVFDCSSPLGFVATQDDGWSVFARDVMVPASFFAP